jgi:hypothetical protein
MVKSVDIDEAVVKQLEAIAKARAISVRSLMREILTQAARDTVPLCCPARFIQKTHDFGSHVEAPWTLLAELESEEHVQKYAKK